MNIVAMADLTQTAAIDSGRRAFEMAGLTPRDMAAPDPLPGAGHPARARSAAATRRRNPTPQPDAASRAAYLERTAPRIACHIVPGASHWVAFEAPDDVNRLMVDFLGARGRRDEAGEFV